jgi:RND superfamily putative drug exporter
VLLFWLVALIGVTLITRSVGTAYSNSFTLPNTESTHALSLLESAAPKQSGDTEQVVFQATGGTKVTDPSVEAAVDQMISKVATVPHVSNFAPATWAFPGASSHVSPDGTIGFVTVTFNQENLGENTALAKQFVSAAKTAQGPDLQVAVAGNLAEASNPTSFGGIGTLLGVILAAGVLFFVFRAGFAMALPLISALGSLGTAIGVIGLLSHLLKMPQFSVELVALIGLGVGVDYALFIVTRHRQGLIAGFDTEASIVNAVNTSGRAVLFAGIIVCIALLGMFALGVTFLYGLAVAAAIGVAFTMLAALTLLPAFLGFIGPKVLSRKQKRELATTGPRVVGSGTTGFWPRWAGLIQRHSAVPAAIALIAIVLIALPFFSLRLGSSDQGNDPTSTTTRQAFDLLAKGFGPGFNGPLQLVTVNPGTANTQVIDQLANEVKTQPDVARVSPPVIFPAKDGTQVALVQVYPSSAPQDGATSTLINQLRLNTIPQAVSGSNVSVYVGGNTAIFADFSRVLTSKLPLFIGLVVVLSFLLLALVFRSLVIPLTAAVMNLLSIGAAFGVLVAVFQWGWLSAIFGVNRAGPVESFLPVMLFAILFGLSMDYEVFLVSRIHEEWIKCGDSREAVRKGLAATGKTITAAALIMILVFGSFMFGGQRVIKEFGLGLAAGILIDAVIIRMTIVPALMFLFGKANWFFPDWLDRILPHLSAGGEEAAPEVAVEPSRPEPEPDPLPV